MANEKQREMMEALHSFVLRVAKGEANQAESEILPEIAKIVLAQPSSFLGSPVK